MTKEIIMFSVMLVAGTSACTSRNAYKKDEMISKDIAAQNDTIKLTINATRELEIGYGTIFNCHVKKSNEGSLNGSDITLVLIKADYMQYLMEHSLACEITFVKIRENVEEKYLPINGFVDENKTAWEIVRME